MSILYSPNFKNLEGELRKNQEFMGSDIHHHQQQQHNSGLMRYRSAPNSFFGSFLDSSSGGRGGGIGVGSAGGGCEDFRYLRSSSPEVETILDRFISCTGSGDSKSHDMQEFGVISTKQEVESSASPVQNGYSNGSSEMMYQAQEVHALQNGNSVSVGSGNSYGVMNSVALENSMQAKMGNGNCSNLVRQNSSPAGFFTNLNVENGFTIMRDVGNFRACNGTNGEASPSTGRLNGHLNFSSGPSSCSRLMPQIAENENESMGATSPDDVSLGNGNGSKRCYMTSFTTDSWDDSDFNGLKRARNDHGNMLSDLSALDNENGESGKRPPALVHHLSLPKTSAEMAAIEKFLQFQGPVPPLKIRAKRGFATHPRSIAERVRRTRISERMRKLQELFPNMDKQTNTADMLDLAVEHIKDLQKQVKTLGDAKAKCTCTSKLKQYSNPSA